MNYQETYQRLKYRKQELCTRLKSIEIDFDSAEELDDMLFTIAHETKVELATIKKLLTVCEEGNYGLCQNCGKEIATEVLDTQPFTLYCSECDDKINK